MTDNLQIAENSLALLDDIGGADMQTRLDRFAVVDAWIDSSIDSTLARAASAQAAVSVVAPLTNAPPPTADTPIPAAIPTASGSPTSAAATIAAEHVVFSNSLSQRSSRQKLQNESLIKSLQELRARMNDSKLKSGKVITS